MYPFKTNRSRCPVQKHRKKGIGVVLIKRWKFGKKIIINLIDY